MFNRFIIFIIVVSQTSSHWKKIMITMRKRMNTNGRWWRRIIWWMMLLRKKNFLFLGKYILKNQFIFVKGRIFKEKCEWKINKYGENWGVYFWVRRKESKITIREKKRWIIPPITIEKWQNSLLPYFTNALFYQ